MRKYLIKIHEINNPENECVYTTLTGLCDDKGFSHNWLKTKKYPFEYKGFKFKKMECKLLLGGGYRYD